MEHGVLANAGKLVNLDSINVASDDGVVPH